MSARVRRPLAPDVIRPYLIEIPTPPAILDLEETFGRPGPFELEVGFGKGRFLLEAATQWPETCFFGIEIRHVLRDFCADRIARRELTNVKVMQGDARQLLAHALVNGTLNAIHFYFPDPWWKKRHMKRRIWTESLFRDFVRVIRPGGHLHLASDVASVYERLVPLATSLPELTEAPEAVVPELCTTNFEDKAIGSGRMVQRTAFVRA